MHALCIVYLFFFCFDLTSYIILVWATYGYCTMFVSVLCVCNMTFVLVLNFLTCNTLPHHQILSLPKINDLAQLCSPCRTCCTWTEWISCRRHQHPLFECWWGWQWSENGWICIKVSLDNIYTYESICNKSSVSWAIFDLFGLRRLHHPSELTLKSCESLACSDTCGHVKDSLTTVSMAIQSVAIQ